MDVWQLTLSIFEVSFLFLIWRELKKLSLGVSRPAIPPPDMGKLMETAMGGIAQMFGAPALQPPTSKLEEQNPLLSPDGKGLSEELSEPVEEASAAEISAAIQDEDGDD